MPILLLLGVPKHQQTTLFEKALQQRISGIPELKLKPEEITIKFLADADDEIIIFVEGLFDKPERTEEVRKNLAERIVLCGQKYLPEATLIECFVRLFDPKQGFYSISK